MILNSGMKNQVANGIWARVRPTVLAGGSAGSVFGHKGKSAAIDAGYRDRVAMLEAYNAATDKLAHLEGLPWIGGITCWHLAKNLGHDCAKPDRHLARIAGTEGTHALCARIAAVTGERIATVDVVIWRAANLRLPGTTGTDFAPPVHPRQRFRVPLVDEGWEPGFNCDPFNPPSPFIKVQIPPP